MASEIPTSMLNPLYIEVKDFNKLIFISALVICGFLLTNICIFTIKAFKKWLIFIVANIIKWNKFLHIVCCDNHSIEWWNIIKGPLWPNTLLLLNVEIVWLTIPKAGNIKI